jgi:LysR family transcriptional activator of nhaA
MRHLNYSHLHYFWAVANEGSIARASKVLHITPQTISSQPKLLDDAVVEPLFLRAGRGLVLTDTGRQVEQYADDIFALGGELAQVVRESYLTISPERRLKNPAVVHVIESARENLFRMD